MPLNRIGDSVSAEASQLGTRLDSGLRGTQLFDAEASRGEFGVASELLGGALTSADIDERLAGGISCGHEQLAQRGETRPLTDCARIMVLSIRAFHVEEYPLPHSRKY